MSGPRLFSSGHPSRTSPLFIKAFKVITELDLNKTTQAIHSAKINYIQQTTNTPLGQITSTLGMFLVDLTPLMKTARATQITERLPAMELTENNFLEKLKDIYNDESHGSDLCSFKYALAQALLEIAAKTDKEAAELVASMQAALNETSLQLRTYSTTRGMEYSG